MSAPDPSSSFNLEYLKKHAKHLLRACRNGEASTIAEMQSALSRLASLDPAQVASEIQLADVQHALAVQRGFSSWAALTRHGDPLARLLAAVRGGHSRSLRRQLHEFTGLAAVSVHAASALGNVAQLTRHLESDPTLATRSDGRWVPLIYVSASPLVRFSARHAASLVTCAERLLDAGASADIGASDDDASEGATPIPAILRAMMGGNISLVTLLGKRGAPQPLDSARQVIAEQMNPQQRDMHAIFGEYFRRPEVREQMRKSKEEFDGRPNVDAWTAIERLESSRSWLPNFLGARADLWAAMLDRGYDPTALGRSGSSHLHWVATYATPAFIELVLARGVNPNVRDDQGRSVIATAVRAGNGEVAEVLRGRGIEDDSTPMDRLIGVCVAGDDVRARQIVRENPQLVGALSREDVGALVSAAGRGEIDRVRLMLDVGIQPDVRDETGAAALHQAAWRGHLDVTRLLLNRGAAVSLPDDLYGETPREWALHGSLHAQGVRRGRCLAIAEMLEETQ